MKKLFYIFGLVIGLSLIGCSKNTESENKIDNTDIKVSEFKYKGHSYIEFYGRHDVMQYKNFSIVHNPDCKCVQNQ